VSIYKLCSSVCHSGSPLAGIQFIYSSPLLRELVWIPDQACLPVGRSGMTEKAYLWTDSNKKIMRKLINFLKLRTNGTKR
jgi:hypothetical protein